MPTRPTYFRSRFQPAPTPERRAVSSQRGYDAAWRRLRLSFIKEHPLCQVCESRGRTTPATCVDHRVPITVDPSRRLDATNLRSCCTDCHGEITARFKTTGINEPWPDRSAA
jgi:5-methylcytosine-specific restriction protein A